jgi:DNA-directed RNA polymerase subunit RPC12/RpoP
MFKYPKKEFKEGECPYCGSKNLNLEYGLLMTLSNLSSSDRKSEFDASYRCNDCNAQSYNGTIDFLLDLGDIIIEITKIIKRGLDHIPFINKSLDSLLEKNITNKQDIPNINK